MHYFYLIIPTIISLVNIHCHCMEQKVVPYNPQIVLHLDDGNDFSIKKHKIFDSEVMYTNYLRRELSCNGCEIKNMSLLYSKVNKEQMVLYSDACDIEPGKSFKDYFNTLSPEKQRSLIITAGELKNSVLCGELWQAYVDPDPRITHKHIKPEMQQSVWWDRCINQTVKENLPIVFPTRMVEESIVEKYTNNGHIQDAPSSLLNGSYDGQYFSKRVTHNGKQWYAFLVKPLDGSYEYHVTKAMPINETEKKEKNKILLWLNKDDKENEKSIIIEHEDPIRHRFFSDNGEYLVSYSFKNLVLSKIRKENGELFVTSFIIPTSIPISRVNLNPQATICAVFCWVDHEQKGNLSLWNISADNCVKIFEREGLGYIPDASFNDAGDRLLTVLIEGKTAKALIWNTENVHKVALIGSIETPFARACVSCPNRKKWIITCVDFRTKWSIFVDECYDGLKVFHPKGCGYDDEMLIAYSPNGRFVAILYPYQDIFAKESEKSDLVVLYSVITHEKLGQWYTQQAEGLGFTADSRKLIFNHNNRCSHIDLLNQGNINNLYALLGGCSLAQSTLLRRLCLAHDHEDTVELYKEGQPYKAFLKLPEQYKKLIAKCFPGVKIIDNKKDISQICTDLAQIADSIIENIRKISAFNVETT